MKTLVFITGASGSGKTTATRILAEAYPRFGETHHFDTIGVPSSDEMTHRFGGAEAWQKWATSEWVRRLASTTGDLHLIEGQTRPSFIVEAVAGDDELEARIVLLDCARDVRRRRLSSRGSPELDTRDMENWAAYLVGQAHALGLAVVDTSAMTPDETAREIAEGLSDLLERDH